MGVQLGSNAPKPRKGRRRVDRRSSYLDKVSEKRYDDFNCDDMREFFGDLYKLSYGMHYVPQSIALCNGVFGELIKEYGPRRTLDYISASFGHRHPPRSVTWYRSGYFREFSDDAKFQHSFSVAQDLLDEWQEMHSGLLAA